MMIYQGELINILVREVKESVIRFLVSTWLDLS